ncbi:uncharacterized protein Z518_03391 [Rhinocladiella mackenziei CBS 650.93]|uniref:Uncharacterized protein n=1 Tax=Rhinocladiella mackenziei CBS 650.93 TaxID=1442369 RepID=A0A0D2IRW3_9EURO|nr:uncharacterized protein Z518_03391 [Rhinocladiella mackenziei CBS 650.93]KIX08734.1 hypothetical protein Z518_03391 [Rhinocladiella mackenziei CBS 650.93]
MGIIKAAIITGAGLYAVNKITKRAEHRRDNSAPSSNGSRESRQPQYLDDPDSRGYDDDESQMARQERSRIENQRGVDGPPLQFKDCRLPAQQGQPLYLVNNNPYAPLPYGYNGDVEHVYETDPRATLVPGYPPPFYQTAYGPRQQQRQGFVEPGEVSESEFQIQSGRNSSGSATLVNTLAQQAMAVDGDCDEKKEWQGKRS